MFSKYTRRAIYIGGCALAGGYAHSKYKPINLIWDLDHTLIQTVKVDRDKLDDHQEPDFVMKTSDPNKIRCGYVRRGAYCYLQRYLNVCILYIFT